MTLSFSSEAERLTWERSPEPGWIDSPHGPLFSWFHPPQGPMRSRAILLCEPLGHDRMNLHLTYRHIALAFSRAGYPTLRFDYAGTGDSSGSPRDSEWAYAWTTGLTVATDWLLSHTQTSSVALFGARLGGTLAARFAADRPEVDALILWGAYSSGRAFLRNERALHQIINANPAGRKPSLAQPDDREFGGYLYNPEARAELEAIDLLQITESICHSARIFAWDSESSEDQLAAQLTETGVGVKFSRPSLYASEASLTKQEVPQELLRESLEWLNQLDDPLPCESQFPKSGMRRSNSASVFRQATTPPHVDEEAIYFGNDRGLFGIMSHARSDPDRPGRPGLILVSGGNNPRSGINRNYTEWARSAALHGVPTLRFDVRGLGDSPALLAKDLNQLYRHDTIQDVSAAIDTLQAQSHSNGIVLCGLCAGAFQTLHTALADDRVAGIILLDLLRWDLDPTRVPLLGFLDRRRRNIKHLVDTLRVAFLGAHSQPAPSLLGELLTRLVDRKVQILTVGCRNRGGLDQFIDALQPIQSELEASGYFTIDALENTDHIFSPLWAQEWLSERIERAVDDFARTAEPSSDANKTPTKHLS